MAQMASCCAVLFSILFISTMTWANQVTGFVLVNADTDSDITAIESGAVINLAILPTRHLNIRAVTDPAVVDNVAISLAGNTTASTTEGKAPYALWGDTGGDYAPGTLNTGSHILSATPTVGSTPGATATVNFSVIDDGGGLPSADAGVDQFVTLPTDSAVLSGSGSDDGTITTYQWTQINGPNTAVLDGDDTATVTLSGLIAGTYTLRLTVGDNDANTAHDDVNIAVSDQNSVGGGAFVEQNGIIVMEAENGTPESSDEWSLATDVDDYRGRGLIRWEGGNHFNDKTHGVLAFRIRVTNAGTYHLRLRAFHDPVAHGTTTDQENDVWTNHQLDSADAMYKTFRPGGTAGDPWTICGTWEPTHGNFNADPSLEIQPGEYTFRIAARSENFMIDRLYLVQDTGDLSHDLPESPRAGGSSTISGEMKKWHKVTLTFDGPSAEETATPNPFTDFRLNVIFTNGTTRYEVPGYFAADGNAAETGATGGSKWRAHFSPDLTGRWQYQVSFRSGPGIAVNADAAAGAPVAPLDGMTGSFDIADTDKSGRDHRGKGRLQYNGGHYLKFSETGEYFLKQGADAPENFLAYEDFDNTPDNGGRRKNWAPHQDDWKDGDPTWQGGKGKGIIGAINYLASEGMNVFSFIPMNIGGDDKNVFPYFSDNASHRTRMDCSKLDQWEIVFSHADHMGMFMHFKTLETENETLLDGGDLGTERKLYYRELIARFGHHLALNWNLGEEINNSSTAQKNAWAKYFHDTDPYNHHIVIHNGSNHYELMGPGSELTGFSLQTSQSDFSQVHDRVKDYLQRSVDAGKPWAVACDEPGDASHALRPDDDAGNSHEDGRKNGLWGTLMAGGWGNEWYFGYQHAHSDLSCQDFRSRDQWWDYGRFALSFFKDNTIPFWQMINDNDLSSADDDYCFYQEDLVYVIYLKNGGTTDLDLRETSGDFKVKWYDPRSGGGLQDGSQTDISGGDWRNVGQPPSEPTGDWVILVRGAAADNQPPTAHAGPDQTITDAGDSGEASVTLDGSASFDTDGSIADYQWVEGGVSLASGSAPTVTLSQGTHTLTLTVVDDMGATDTDNVIITVAAPGEISNQAPVIESLPAVSQAQVVVGEAVTLQVGATDPEAQALTYTWTIISGPGNVTFDPNGTEESNNSQAVFDTAGEYVLQVAVSDGALTVSETLTVTVSSNGGEISGDEADQGGESGGSGGGGGCFIRFIKES